MNFFTAVFFSFCIQASFALPSLTRRDCSRSNATTEISKRGIAYNTASFASLFDQTKINWAYNWGQTSDGLPDGFDYVPMLWGSKATSTWDQNVQTAIDSGSQYILGFNEPDNGGQANMDAGTAASLWRQYMEPYSCSAYLGAPAVTNGGPPMGLAWLKDFLGQCSDCTIDFVPIHWYDSATNIDYFKNYVQDAYTAGGQRPIWITEFGFVSGSEEDINNFFAEILPWLDSLDYVDRYSHFMADNNQGLLPLVASSGNVLSNIGGTYNTI
jgi:Glycosyl hydrolase catalytic core